MSHKKSIQFVLVLLGILLSVWSGKHYANQKIHVAIERGAEWFLNNQDENFLHYQYSPFEKKHSESHHAMREMGSMWALTQVAPFLNDARYMELAEKGFRYFKSTFEVDQEHNFVFVNATLSKIKLGYSAFAILTLLELDHPKKMELLNQLANGILYQQNEDGSFRTFFYSDRATGLDYYPGEALLALMSLYEVTGEARYLNAVEKALDYYRGYWEENANTAFVSWQSQAYFELVEATGNEAAREFIFAMNDYMLQRHQGEGNGCSRFDFSRSNSVTAVYMEGVNVAYELAQKVSDEKREKCYSRFLKEGAQFILTLQFTPENTFGITNYENAALGGFLGSLDSDSMQVDRNQHAVMALMRWWENGALR